LPRAKQPRLDGSERTATQIAEANQWLESNMGYLIVGLNLFFKRPKWAEYKSRYYQDIKSIFTDTCLRYHYRYKEGPRGLNSWLLRNAQYHGANFINRVVIPLERKELYNSSRECDYDTLDRYFVTKDFTDEVVEKMDDAKANKETKITGSIF